MPADFDFDRDMRGQHQIRDRAIAELAARQHGVVARRQLIALGLTPDAVDRRVATSRVHCLYRGVYAVGHRRTTVHGRWMAAVLACGPNALLSHRCAADLHELLRTTPSDIDITVPGAMRHHRPRITLHHTSKLDPADRTTVDGIPVTTVARTLLDLAAVVRPRQLRRALEEADRRDKLDFGGLERLIEQNAGRRGLRSLRALLQTYAPDPAFTRSELERRFLALCRRAGLPRPAMNMFIEGYEVDAVWPEHTLIVEIDGYASHSGRAAFERDRARDAALQRARYRVVRITERQLDHEPAAVVALLRALLA